MNRDTHRGAGRALLGLAVAGLLSACGTVSGVRHINDAGDLAIDCRHDEALAALDRAGESGMFGAALADLERVVFLRDAGRLDEADAALAARNAAAGATEEEAAEAEQAVAESLEALRSEREKRTGRRDCP